MGPAGSTWTFTPQREKFSPVPQLRKIPFTFGPPAATDTRLAMPTLKFAVLAGDYIGPEVMSEALRVLDHVARQENIVLLPTAADVGGAGIDRHGKALPDSTLRICEESDAILFGSV